METYIIYLAAGNSRRFGTNKLFYKINDKELYRYGLDNLIKLVSMRNDCKLIVVTQYFEITKASYSIKAGLEMINKQDNFQVMFVVADQVNLNYQTLNKMLDTYNASNYSLATLSYQNKVGNPTIFDCKYVDELKQLKGDYGGRKVLNKYLDECLFFEVNDHKELFDIDVIEDLNNDIASNDL